MTNYFAHEYKLSPIVEELYAVIEKHCGNPTAPFKQRFGDVRPEEAMHAAIVIWAALASRGNKVQSEAKVQLNRNTIRKYVRTNPYLEPVRDVLFNPEHSDMYALKCKMGLASRE